MTAAAPPRSPAAARPEARGRVLVNLVGIVVFVVMVFPVYWMVATAFKPGQDIRRYTPEWFPFTRRRSSNFSRRDQPAALLGRASRTA